MTTYQSASPVDEPLLDVASHVMALQMQLHALRVSHEGEESVTTMLDDLLAQCSLLSDATADAGSYLRETHSLDPLIGVSHHADGVAVSLVTAYLDDVEYHDDYRMLRALLDEQFTSPGASYRTLAAVMAALTRLGATLARNGDELTTAQALANLRQCLVAAVH
jgi:hypothetical protein